MRASDIDAPHDCGGTVLVAWQQSRPYLYCDRCGAFAHGGDMPGQTLPSGVDRAANRAAWDAGDERSPEGSAAE